MKKVTAIIRPEKLEELKDELNRRGLPRHDRLRGPRLWDAARLERVLSRP